MAMQQNATNGGGGVTNYASELAARANATRRKPAANQSYSGAGAGVGARKTLPNVVSNRTPTPSSGGGGGGSSSFGNSASQTKDLQRRLGITVDGSYGPQTRAAVKAYQQKNGLQVDGSAGPETWSHLRGNSSSSPSSGGGGGSEESFDPRAEFDHINVGGSPDLPDQINMDDYGWEEATIGDLQQKYGFDYSRDYAERIAETQAQAKRDSIATQREQNQNQTASAKDDLKHNFFNQFLEQQQSNTNSGLNAGLAEDKNTRLEMNRQNALGDVLAQSQLRSNELSRNEGRIDQERVAQEDQLFNERAQQAFQQIQQLDSRSQADAMQRLQQAVAMRGQQVDESWREHNFNNMSTSQYETFIQDVKRYGMEMALQRHQFDADMEFKAGYNG